MDANIDGINGLPHLEEFHHGFLHLLDRPDLLAYSNEPCGLIDNMPSSPSPEMPGFLHVGWLTTLLSEYPAGLDFRDLGDSGVMIPCSTWIEDDVN
jgi:hypothetical protein